MTTAIIDGTVRDDEALTLAELQQRLGVTASTIRAARRKGLKIKRFGKRRLVQGEEFNRYLREDADEG